MAFSYDHEKALLEAQAAAGRVTQKAAATRLEDLTQAEIARFEKCADDFHFSDRGLSRAYLDKAAALRGRLVADKAVLADLVKSAPIRNVGRTIRTRQHQIDNRLSSLEQRLAGDPMKRPIGKTPAVTGGVQADLAKTALPLGFPRAGVSSKPTSEMTNAEKAAHYRQLGGQSPTPAAAQEMFKIAAVYEERARHGEA